MMASNDLVKNDAASVNERKKRYLVSCSRDVQELWKDLRLSSLANSVKEDVFESPEDPVKTVDFVLGEELHCRTCQISFTITNEEDYRFHYKSDWHRYNIKNKLLGKLPVTEQTFLEIEDGVSSISGSESDEEKSKETSFGSPKVFFQNHLNQQLAIYRCLLHPRKKQPPSDEELLELINQLPERNIWAIIMLGGGHFAAAVYKGADMVLHKTFHSYTVRAKQGGSQSSRDNKSGGGSHPKSGGASLRRYNEAAFAQHVNETLVAWADTLKQCHMIFYRAASSNQTIVFGGKTPALDKSDPRLRSIPFPTRRATLKEVKRVWLALATVEIIDESESLAADELNMDKLKLEKSSKSTPETSDDELKILEEQRAKRTQRKMQAKISSAVADQPVVPNSDELGLFPGEKAMMENITAAVNRGNIAFFDQQIATLSDILAAYQEEYHLQLTDVLNQRIGEDCATLLHLASAMNKRANIVWRLLELGCDPSLSDALGRVPYAVAKDKETRDTFRRFMGSFPDRYDYAKALIPSPLTEEMEKQRLEKAAEKRKQQKQARKEKKVVERVRLAEEKRCAEEQLKVLEALRKEQEEKDRFLQLSDREKRALAAERRMLASMAASGVEAPILVRCFFCGVDMSGKVPFEYSSNKFCSTQCLQKHRKSTIK